MGANTIAGQTYVVYQRGRSYCASFYDATCYRFFLLRLLHSVNNYHVKLHAYCLLQQEVILLLTPGTPTGLSRLLQGLNNSYTEYFNLRFGRSGRVFQRPPSSSLIQGDDLLLDCQKFVERAALEDLGSEHPGRHRWSSYCSNAFGGRSHFIVPHRAFLRFLHAAPHPHRRYRDFVATPFSDAYKLYLQATLKFGRAPAKRRWPLQVPMAVKRRSHCRSSAAHGQQFRVAEEQAET